MGFANNFEMSQSLGPGTGTAGGQPRQHVIQGGWGGGKWLDDARIWAAESLLSGTSYQSTQYWDNFHVYLADELSDWPPQIVNYQSPLQRRPWPIQACAHAADVGLFLCKISFVLALASSFVGLSL